MNVVEDFPLAIVTVNGSFAEGELDVRLTESPPVEATPLRVTVPFAEAPPTRLEGLTATDASTGPLIVSVADCDAPFALAVIVANF